MGDVQKAFADYCAGQSTMDGKSFAKICKDTKIVDSKCTATDVDLAFAKVKDKNERRITFTQFKEALKILADKKGKTLADLEAKISSSKGPVLSGTVAEANKFHDDKSLYTGVHAKGGPSTIDTDKVADISQIMDRSDADVRGVKKDKAPAAAHTVAGTAAPAVAKSSSSKAITKTASSGAPAKSGSSAKLVSGEAKSLQEVFSKFTAGAAEMDGRVWAKFAKDCGVVNKKCTNTDIDLIFAKVKTNPSARKISYLQFMDGLKQCAAKRGEELAKLEASILEAGGPSFSGTVAEANKFHDDKSLYTGVHAKGGPSTIDTDKVADISQIMDRSPADVRGVKT
eukprot:CAMPEP_0202853172 /NCGR_PEP_ID=MMETSP1389-20130828/90345_1 /ASSEMBLY_ACC=CAM_ASM_000865 /TAXON_ID=302021 /ORGANISM="Rhodomonas sp., Strain CCMP768" /LENGTH=340 /DNA_ID=CAMNT_0049531715 /DNA_START=37 /DNA_END=1059 /DNA_ORIENTATION=+